MPNRFPCPRCGRVLVQAGEAEVEGKTYPIYQCDECIVMADFGVEKFKAAFTFALDEHGRPCLTRRPAAIDFVRAQLRGMTNAEANC